MKVVIGSDHGAYDLKEELKAALTRQGVELHDVGCHGRESVDYPVYAHQVARLVEEEKFERGILLCGTGLGMSMAANRHRGVRAAVCGDCFSAEMARAHNDANVLCLGARVVGPGLALKIASIFLEGTFDGGRHVARVAQINEAP